MQEHIDEVINDSGTLSVNALDYAPDGTRIAIGSIFSGAVHVRLVSGTGWGISPVTIAAVDSLRCFP